MWKTTLRRFIILIPQLFALSILIFVLAEFMPGDALTGLWEDPTMCPYEVRAIRERHGLYDPWYVRYVRWVGNMFRGDFGNSLVHRIPVTDMIGERMGNTILLSTLSVLIIYAFAIPLGIIAGRFHGRWPERAISFYNFIQLAFPNVVLALMLQWLFALRLGWLPLVGSVDVLTVAQGSTFQIFLSRIEHATLPALALSLLAGVGVIQLLANEINDNKNMDYANLAISKGVPLNQVYTRHIFRNALLPIAASSGGIIVGLFSGAVITETIFSYNGMGRLFVSSIGGQDWPVANFLIIFYSTLSVIGFLISDIVLTIFDPRIRIK